MGYSIDQLKKASSIKGNEGIPIQQQGVTRQFTPGLLDQAEIITAAGSQSSGVIRREMTYALKNNSAVINFTLEGAIGQVYNAASGNYDDNADAAAGWIVQVINISIRAHTIIHGSTSWSISPNDTVYFFWTGSAWTLHNMRVNGLTVDGPFAGAGVDTKVGGMINNALANLDKTKVIMLQDGNVDFNTVFVNANGEKATYFIYGDSSKPNSNAPMEKNTTSFIVESVFSNGRVTQTAYENEMHNLMYIRTKGYDNAWTEWIQIATNSDLNSFVRTKKMSGATSVFDYSDLTNQFGLGIIRISGWSESSGGFLIIGRKSGTGIATSVIYGGGDIATITTTQITFLDDLPKYFCVEVLFSA